MTIFPALLAGLMLGWLTLTMLAHSLYSSADHQHARRTATQILRNDVRGHPERPQFV